MLNPIIAEYINADRTDEARRQAGQARLAREVRAQTREARAAGRGTASGVPRRWRAWGWSLTPRSFGSAGLLPR